MSGPESEPRRWRFGAFEFDLAGSQLLEDCKPVRIATQPLRLLGMLVQRAGALVTRPELQQALWPEAGAGFEASLNSAMRRLRQALGDDNAQPRFILTVPGQGYRFIAPLEAVPAPPASRARAAVPWPLWVAAGVAAIFLSGWLFRPVPSPRVRYIRQLTQGGGLDFFVRPATDGRRIYYLKRAGGHWALMAVGAQAPPEPPRALPFANARLLDVSRDGRAWLLGKFRVRGEPMTLWRAVPGGQPVRLGSLVADEALWDPDGRHFLFAANQALWRARADGSHAVRLWTLPGRASWLAWSPGAHRLRFTTAGAAGYEEMEWRPGAGPPRVLPFPLPRCCGQWTSDGRYFLFSALSGKTWNLWAQRRADWRLWRAPQPVQLTFGPQSYWGAFTLHAADEVVVYQVERREEMQRLDPRSRLMQVQLGGRNAMQEQISPDGRHVAYLAMPDQTIWAGDTGAGGTLSHLRRISPPGVTAAFPRWSPDSRAVAYFSQAPGQPNRISIATLSSAPPRLLLPPAEPPTTEFATPDWSPHGHRLVVAISRHGAGGKERDAIAILDLATERLEIIAGSAGLAAPRWSPDGRWLAAFSADQHRLEVYSFARRRWRTLAQGNAFSIPDWSRDSRYLYYQDLLSPGQALYRASAADWRPELVADFSAQLASGIHRCGLMTVAPDGAPLVSFNRGTADLCLARLDLP